MNASALASHYTERAAHTWKHWPRLLRAVVSGTSSALRTWIHTTYLVWCAAKDKRKEQIASYKFFLEIREKFFSTLHLDKKTELKRCIICTKLATLLEQALREAGGSQRWLDIELARRWVLHEHKALKHGEWLAFTKLEALTTDASSPFLFLAFDGSPGLSIPSLSNQVAGLPTLPYYLVGVKLYSPRGVQNFTYLAFTPLFPDAKGCDYWLSSLFDTVRTYLDECGDQRPRVLILHLDNTVRHT
jgi:hypothetical protein